MSVGENFHYGQGASGNPAKLAEEGGRLGFDVHAEPLLEIDGAPVSSSRVRELIATGAVERAGALLGRPPWVEGAVVHGEARGRDRGFLMANLALVPRSAIPAVGVYAGHRPSARLEPRGRDQHRLQPDVHRRPQRGTRRGRPTRLRHIYGSPIRLDLAHRLRDEIRYDSVDALLESCPFSRRRSGPLTG